MKPNFSRSTPPNNSRSTNEVNNNNNTNNTNTNGTNNNNNNNNTNNSETNERQHSNTQLRSPTLSNSFTSSSFLTTQSNQTTGLSSYVFPRTTNTNPSTNNTHQQPIVPRRTSDTGERRVYVSPLALDRNRSFSEPSISLNIENHEVIHNPHNNSFTGHNRGRTSRFTRIQDLQNLVNVPSCSSSSASSSSLATQGNRVNHNGNSSFISNLSQDQQPQVSCNDDTIAVSIPRFDNENTVNRFYNSLYPLSHIASPGDNVPPFSTTSSPGSSSVCCPNANTSNSTTNGDTLVQIPRNNGNNGNNRSNGESVGNSQNNKPNENKVDSIDPNKKSSES